MHLPSIKVVADSLRTLRSCTISDTPSTRMKKEKNDESRSAEYLHRSRGCQTLGRAPPVSYNPLSRIPPRLRIAVAPRRQTGEPRGPKLHARLVVPPSLSELDRA
ncbi:uncharacterized protein LOC143149103 [Ptiloglossa arizonensis]|uniref:uncharacterized protein LOC143149103 n=1 Tax=Ptiloglossa arizonensis TaxID=3350558 RepID=UPI003F9F3B87